MTFPICATCAVEHERADGVCAICADDRQYVPEQGQLWTSLEELAAEGYHCRVEELEPGLLAVATVPGVGIGQTAKLVVTGEGSVLWDPTGFVDDHAIEKILQAGPVVAIVASHPHMYGVQLEWSARLGGVPVYVCEADAEWVQRPGAAITLWRDEVELAPGVTIAQIGGHFPGSAVLHWADGAAGRGVLLTGDTVFPVADRRSVSFLRSYPNQFPLSGAVAERIAHALDRFDYDRIYGNFENVIREDARSVVHRSAERHAAWARGDFDHLT